MQVVDASVVLKWALEETGRRASLRLLDAYETGQTDLIAPRLLREEVAGALWKRCRSRQITSRQAQAAFGFLEQRMPLLIDSGEMVREALELSVSNQLSLWEALYVALAIRRRCDLVTADPRLYRAARRHYPAVILLGA